MQWDDGPNAGFAPAHATTWLPVHPESRTVNVAAQDQDPGSLLSTYRRLLALRRETPALHAGTLELLDEPRLPGDVVAYRRSHGEGDRRATADVFLNFSKRRVALDLRGRGDTVFSNQRGDAAPSAGGYTLAPYEGILLLGGA
jgi:glycosidase